MDTTVFLPKQNKVYNTSWTIETPNNKRKFAEIVYEWRDNNHYDGPKKTNPKMWSHLTWGEEKAGNLMMMMTNRLFDQQ